MCYSSLLHALISYNYGSVSSNLTAVMMTMKLCRYRLGWSDQISINSQFFGKEIKIIRGHLCCTAVNMALETAWHYC